MDSTEFDKVQEGVSYVKSICKNRYKPRVGVVCGSGLGGLADHLEDTIHIPYSDIPHFVKSTGKSGFQLEIIFRMQHFHVYTFD